MQWKADCPERDRKLSVYRRRWGKRKRKARKGTRTLSEVSDADAQLAQLYSQLADVDNLLNDFNHELAEYQKNCEFSDEEFYETEKRLNEINHLKTKYGNSYEKIMDYCKKQEERIEILENYDAYMQELKASCEQLEQDYLKKGTETFDSSKEEGKHAGKEDPERLGRPEF